MIQYIHELGLQNMVYYLFHVVGFLTIFAFNYFYAKKYNISGKKSMLITLMVYSFVYVWIYIQFWIESGFELFGGNNIVRGFVYIPLIAYPVFKLFKVDWKRGCDFIAPCVPLVQTISHIGCIFTGCCKGYPCSFGIPSPDGTQTLFPSQLLEAATAGIITIVILVFAKRRHYDSKGYAFPLMLVLFGSTRFFWEFARDNRKIFLGCSSLAFHALFMCIVGIVIMLCLRNKDRKNKKHKKHKSKR